MAWYTNVEMAEPRLYERYTRAEVIGMLSHFGLAPRALCDGQWLVFPTQIVCLAELGDAPARSHFATGSTFFWVAEKPFALHDGTHTSAIPREVMGTAAGVRTLRLFVRPAGAEAYVYAGELEPSFMQQAGGAGNHGMARFSMRTTLPSRVWQELGGLVIGDADPRAVDAALDRLRGPTTAADRLDVLRRVVEYWHGPIGADDGLAISDDARMPHPLRWWYRWAGRRQAILSGQNRLLAPDDLKREDDHLLFYLENQDCYRWATELDGEDPDVVGRADPTAAWEREGRLTEHLIAASVFEAVMCHAKYGASVTSVEPATFAKLAALIPPLAIPAWRWVGPVRFYGKGGAFMYAMTADADPCVWIGARTEEPLAALRPLVDDRWDYVAL